MNKTRILLGLAMLIVLMSLAEPSTGTSPSSPQTMTEECIFQGPFGIAVKPDGSFYVAEIQGKCIAKFDAQGNFRGRLTDIPGYGPLLGPFDVDIAPGGNIYIADTLGQRIIVLDSNEKLLFTLGNEEASAIPGNFQQPHFIYPDEKNGRIFIADTLNHRVQVFDRQGKLLNVLGSHGYTELNQYHFANGIAVDSQDNLYVMNWSGGYINVYDRNFNPLKTLSPDDTDRKRFNDAYSIAIDHDVLWVADTYNNRLLKLALNGQVLAVIGGQEGADVHQFSHPADIDFDGKGNLYVADWKNDRVLKLTPDGYFLRQWGTPAAVLNFTAPTVYPRNPCRQPRLLGAYVGIDKRTIDLAAQAGIDWVYPSFDNQDGNWDIKDQVDYARDKGIKVAPSIAVYALGHNHPQWQDKPQYVMRKRGSSWSAGPLSYFFPEVRSWKAKHIAQQAAISGVDGILLDYIRYPDTISGYEPAMIQAFKNEFGKDPDQIKPNDPDWLAFRAKFITLFIAELRQELAQQDRHVEISVYVGPDWQSDLQTVMRDWRTWVRMGIVDKLCLGIYSRDLASFYDGVRAAKAACPDRTQINIMIACWGGNLNTPELLEKGVEISFAADADEVSIYRADAIYDLNLWPAIGNISRKYK